MTDGLRYEIRIAERVSAEWATTFAGMEVRSASRGSTLLVGNLADQTALMGVLAALQGLNLTLLSVTRARKPADPEPGVQTERMAGGPSRHNDTRRSKKDDKS